MVNLEKEVTFENTIFEGNTIMLNGEKVKILKVKHECASASDRGHYRIDYQRENFPASDILRISYNEASDCYLLYQNGKK